MPDDQIYAEAPTMTRPVIAPPENSTIAPPARRPFDQRPIRQIVDGQTSPHELERIIRLQLDKLHQVRPVPTISRSHARIKRAMDLALTVPALVILGPVLLAIAIAVRLDSPGPALFRQHRVSQHGRIFRMLKFRTMVNGSGVVCGEIHKRPDDKRVTRLGRLLRQTSLDELPQLINVMRGEMTLVGPRPEIPVVMIERYQPWQYQRLSVPQGITGWWQVNGRGSKLMWQHTEDDVEYINRASIWLDIKILLKTFGAVFRREGAF